MQGFSPETRQAIFDSQGGMCAVKGCLNPIHSFHHCKANTKTNRKLYPLFLQSIFNCKGLCIKHHINYAIWNITDALCRAYETWLRCFLTTMPF